MDEKVTDTDDEKSGETPNESESGGDGVGVPRAAVETALDAPGVLAQAIVEGINDALVAAPDGSSLSTLHVRGAKITNASIWHVFQPAMPPEPNTPSEAKKQWFSIIGDMQSRLRLGMSGGGSQALGRIGGQHAPTQISMETIAGAVRRTLKEACPNDYRDRVAMVLQALSQMPMAELPGGARVTPLNIPGICAAVASMALGGYVAPFGERFAREWEEWAESTSGDKEFWVAQIDFGTDVPRMTSAPGVLIGSFEVIVPFSGRGGLTANLAQNVAQRALAAVSLRG